MTVMRRRNIIFQRSEWLIHRELLKCTKSPFDSHRKNRFNDHEFSRRFSAAIYIMYYGIPATRRE